MIAVRRRPRQPINPRPMEHLTDEEFAAAVRSYNDSFQWTSPDSEREELSPPQRRYRASTVFAVGFHLMNIDGDVVGDGYEKPEQFFGKGC